MRIFVYATSLQPLILISLKLRFALLRLRVARKLPTQMKGVSSSFPEERKILLSYPGRHPTEESDQDPGPASSSGRHLLCAHYG
jgi:hypothetical protein